ncbi:MAG TPA: Crp/Fnr family transcriptional regulator [Bryobacteraceae bacterium]|nr:Crp/Fnr family transcriptional regulator [Bryobacteraceae bacterium]
MNTLTAIARGVLVQLPEVTRLASLRRSTNLFSQGQIGDSVYLIEDGLVKLTRTNNHNGRIIIAVLGGGDIIGEEALTDDSPAYYADAEVLTPASAYRIPRDVLTRTLSTNPELSAAFMSALIHQKRVLAEKVELLCLQDVEYRILHYLAELSSLLRPAPGGEGYQLPITQLELADLIGATRETTSTTLNQLERRGLVKLSRRLLTIPSPVTLRAAAAARTNGQSAAGASASGVL